MVKYGTNNSVHERDGSIVGDEPLKDRLRITTARGKRKKDVVLPDYQEKQKNY